MERLKQLFDYQRFAGHSGLADQIDAVRSKYLSQGEEIPDEWLDVSAAGDPAELRAPDEEGGRHGLH